jgi:Protein of unknown function (DUF2934)
MSDKEQRIRVRAYAIWEGEGRHDGQAEEHWRQAEREIEHALRSAEAQAAEAPEQPPKTAGNRARTSAKATQTGADASGLEGASRKPTTSRKTASVDATSSKVRQKPTATHSRRTPPA